jgi:choline kinase
MKKINVLIPMAGMGQRFKSAGYELPKPLIMVNGETMICKAINSLNIEARYHFVIAKNEYTDLVKKSILELKPDSMFIEIDYITEGPASSCLLFKNEINNSDELVIANCDQIMEWSSDNFFHNVRRYDGAVVTYHTDTNKNSYAKLDKQGHVLEIKEKEVISNVSLIGIHYWNKGSYFIDSCEEMILCQDRAPNGEFYVGPTYNNMVKNGLRVGIHHIPNQQYWAVGVPEDLEKYIMHENITNK